MPPPCPRFQNAGTVAVDDSFTVNFDKALQAVVTANDEGMLSGVAYTAAVARLATVTTPANPTPVAMAAGPGLQFLPMGQLFFNPASYQLKPGSVVTFTYYILPNVANAVRSNNATVTITIVGPTPAPTTAAPTTEPTTEPTTGPITEPTTGPITVPATTTPAMAPTTTPTPIPRASKSSYGPL